MTRAYVAAIVVAAAVGAYALAQYAPDSADPAPDAAPQPDVVMTVKSSRPGCEPDGCYVPTVVSVEAGGQVTWLNEDSAFHSVTSGTYESPGDGFDSGHMDPYGSYTVEFAEPGTYEYFCTLHPWMAGTVVVE